MKNYKKEIADLIGEKTGLKGKDLISLVEIPPTDELGDFAFPCFKLAKEMRKSPNIIAEDLAKEIKSENFQRIENKGAYLNFFLKKEKFTGEVISEILDKGEDYGRNESGKGKTVVLDYSSTNIAKPFHIGHLRSTVIGDSIKRIYNYCGYRAVGINYLGDYGTQFGIMIAAYKKWGNEEKIKENPIEELLNLYVRFNSEAENDPQMMDEARDEFAKLENGEKEEVELWTWFKEISLKEYQRVYEILGIEFDSYDGEAYNSQFTPNVIEELEEKELLEEDDGAKIIRLEEEGLAPAIIIKSNGSSTYIARDIGTAKNRKDVYNFEKNIYVVASQQRLHFMQLKAILKKMGYSWSDDCVHVSFGMVSMKEGTMSTRKGQVIFLEDVLNKAIEKTKAIIDERNPDLENKEETAKMIGVGAIKFQDLFNNRIKDYSFDWDEVLNFDGETGPYVQYAHARAASILSKYGREINFPIDYEILVDEREFQLAKCLEKFPQDIVQAKDNYEPSIISRSLIDIAKAYNRFYNYCPVFSADEDLKLARLSLTKASKLVLKRGLNLLGIEAPEQM